MSHDRFIDAVNSGLRHSMESDVNVLLLGEDLTYGGPFGATKDLVDDFGKQRVRDTPISEATIMGMAIGAAAAGLRPVVEIMFADFMTLAADQLVNHAAKLHFMTGGQVRVPLTVRVQGGVGGLMGAQHSQSLESWLGHVPGLKVVAPSFPSDAELLLVEAIFDDNPVVYLEHRGLYWDKSDRKSNRTLGAEVRRSGDDVTIVAYSKMVHTALDAAEELDSRGVSAEVVDLRWLAPLDMDTVISSARKTGGLVIAHEAVQTCGFGAEIAARAQEALWGKLRGPIRRLGGLPAPVGASRSLEHAFSPEAGAISHAAVMTLEPIKQNMET